MNNKVLIIKAYQIKFKEILATLNTPDSNPNFFLMSKYKTIKLIVLLVIMINMILIINMKKLNAIYKSKKEVT
jgi:hypothetical protein